MKKLISFLAIGFPLFIMTAIFTVTCATRIDSPRKHFLLLDDRVVEKMQNAKLFVGSVEKHAANPLFGEDKPWEMRFDNLYGNVIYDDHEKIYKCWYSPFIVDHSAQGMTLEERNNIKYPEGEGIIREMAICYATSKDGLKWDKPDLGLVEYNGSKDNNILWRGGEDEGEFLHGPHGTGIFKDDQDPNPARRYKAIFKGDIISVAFSEDGIRWDSATACPEADVAGDTHNNAFWSPTLEKYIGITRSWGDARGRQVARTESDDFIQWSKTEVVLEGLDDNLQTYAMPVFYYGGIYIGLLAVHNQKSDRVWTELTWSPDTRVWKRVNPGTPLVPCSDEKLDYDYGCVYPCAYPVFLENEIRLYYGGSDYLHFGWRNGSFCLATLRPDGFAGYEQESKDKTAIITTTALDYYGQTVKITADVAKDGWVKVGILNSDRKYISAAQIISHTVTNAILDFPEEFSLNEIRLQFELSNARIYSFRLDDQTK
jgi:hypothetical protein